MQPDVEKLLRNLGVLAQVKQHDKLLTEGEHFAVYVPTNWRAVYRFAYGENREQNMARVAECIRLAKAAVTRILSEHSAPTSDISTMTYKILHQEQLGICTRIMNALTETLAGLDNLMATYRDDTALVVRINNIKGDVTDFLEHTQIVASSSPVIARLTE